MGVKVTLALRVVFRLTQSTRCTRSIGPYPLMGDLITGRGFGGGYKSRSGNGRWRDSRVDDAHHDKTYRQV
ncbi:hypothetical protein V8F06_007131 [Rhypophila decipiens]